MRSEVIVFRGVKFRRYPESKRRSDRVYFTPGPGDRQKGVRRLHEQVWMAAHGPIPAGCHIHHVDHDPLNNDLDNLACVNGKKHMGDHVRQAIAAGQIKPPSAKALAAAAEWHRSEEGRAWHREHGKRTWEGREPQPGVCDHCGDPFESLRPIRFCSNACKSAWRRASGLDDIDRSCECCGDTYTANRYDKRRFCSRSCSRRHAVGSCACVESDGRRSA